MSRISGGASGLKPGCAVTRWPAAVHMFPV
jgi:hypothetical protein